MKKTLHTALLVILLLLIPLQTVMSMSHMSLYGDEAYHISSGYSKLKTFDYRLLPEDGPLQPVISAFPLLFMNVSFPFDDASWKVKNMDVLMPKFLFEYNKDPYMLIFWSRIPMILLSMILGYYVYRWAKELFGKKAGLFALFLYTFSPDMLAQGQISSSDFAFAVFGVIALYYLWRFIANPCWSSLIVAGITLGLAQLTKFSAIFLFPIYVLVLAIAVIWMKKSKSESGMGGAGPTKTQPMTFLLPVKLAKLNLDERLNKAISMAFAFVLMLVVVYAVILLAYKFEGVGVPLAETISKDIHINRNVYDIEGFYQSRPVFKFIFEKIPSPLPYYFVRGLGYSFMNSDKPAASMVGNGTLITAPYFFIYAFLMKTPIPLLILLFLSLLFANNLKKDNTSEAIMIITFVLYHLAFMNTLKQFGYRYMIHTVPLMFIFASRVINFQVQNLRVAHWFKAFIIIISIWYVASSVAVYPHYISYFNEIIGTENGYKYFGDSNLDWGQDLYYLSDYIKENGIKEPYVSYYGFPESVNYPIPPIYIESYKKPGCERVEGIVAISVSNLMRNQSCYSYLLSETPIKRIGYSIMVYNITSTS